MRSVALSVVFVVLLALGAAPVAVGGTAVDAGSLSDSSTEHRAVESPADRPVSTLQVATDTTPSTVFAVDLRSDRAADWTVTVEYELETDSQQAAFRALAEEFESGTAPAGGLSVGLYENMARFASAETGRQMTIENVERSSTLSGTTGTLSLSFTWRGFLEADGERLVFNDALRSPSGGTWLGSLTDDQTLRVTTPSGYAITSANVPFSENTVTIEGPHTFDPENHVRISLEPSSFADAAWELLGAAAVVAAAIVGGAFLLARRPSGETAAANGGQTPPAPDAHPDSADEPAEDLSLLADDERVLRLLERNDGRMRQAEIVSETDWSDAKVSQLLSSMADDDRITKLRIGRENLISLPDVDALDGSAHDDE